MMNPVRELEPHEVFDTVVSQRAARFGSRQPIPPLPTGRPRNNRSLTPLVAPVFVVDFRPGLADFTKTMLDHAGFATCAFNDYTVAGHAFAFAPVAPWLLMIYDLMANSLGLDLVRACRAMNPQVRVMVERDVPMSFATHNPILCDVVLDQPYYAPVLVQHVRRLWAALERDFAQGAGGQCE